MDSTSTPVIGSLGKVRTAFWRIHQDFLMPHRLAEYRSMLACAVEHGYRIISVEDWAAIVQSKSQQSQQSQQSSLANQKLLVLRHDVDTDPTQMLLTAEIEYEFKAGASYFFRLATLNSRVVRTVAERGFHVSYHFEEIASFAKQHRLLSRAQIEARMPEIHALFAANITELRQRFGLPMRLVCSHGDWINRRLGLMNHALLADQSFRDQIGIDFETYDAALVQPMKSYVSDYPAPFWWKPNPPLAHFKHGDSPLGILTHPRQWRSSIHNATDIVQRAIEGFRYR